MNIVLSIEAIRPPLAGIGRYAWELATRLPAQTGIDTVRYLSDGFWRELPHLEHISTKPGLPTLAKKSAAPVRLGYKDRLRQQLGRLQVFSTLYGKLLPVIAGHRLNGVRDALFHSPNYFVPESHMPSLVTIHDLSVYRYPQWHPKSRVTRMRATIPKAVQRARLVITDSLATRQEVIQEFSLRDDQVVAIPLGVDEVFHPYPKDEITPVLDLFGLRPGEYSFFVSTLEPRKNLRHLLAAYRALPAQMRQRWPLVLVGGEGWQSSDIHDDVMKAQGEGWLKYFGYVDQQFLPVLFAGCRLFVYPSWYEGFGLPIAEAMASGVPVLTSNSSSMPEVAGGAAMLVDPADVDSICHGLQKALEDDAWRTVAIERGLQRAAELTWDACVRNTVAAYQIVKTG
ncbi:glycosyltransferase family 1 protein [Undibacterium sp. TS12]|uniref:glycosyltransferase family 4 protein n=1 Tax=Undibacterium sp. TS12 TaxID=2908202 RepID=UPI001F4CE394|nr:glycosyltransferase family 4 protein [Undibacterium sp. TS12]